MTRRITLLAALLLIAAPALAAETFDKGTWSLELTGSYTHPIRFSENKFYNATAGVGYYFADDVSITAELQGYYTEQPSGDNTVLGGGGLLLRWHALRADRFTLFLDAGGSATMAESEVPDFGTHFNWTGKVGAGATWQLADDLHLIAGVRYFHLSNGNLHGRDQNPSYDGVQYWGGLMWTW